MNAYSKIYEPILIGFLVINLQGFLFFLQLLDLFLQHRNDFLISRGFFPNRLEIELVSKELNHLAAILHVFAGVWILWSKKKIVIIFQKENGNTFTLFIIFIVKSLQKEQNSTNQLLWPPICRNKPAITPKWFNSLDTNSSVAPLLTQFRYVGKKNYASIWGDSNLNH